MTLNFSMIKMRLGRLLIKIELLRKMRIAWLRAKTRKGKGPYIAVLSMGKNGHSYSAARAVKSLGHRALLITDKPQLHEMLSSDAIILRDPLTDIDAIIADLKQFELEAVVVSIKHLLLPAQSAIADEFGLISTGAETGVLNNDKFAWREALAQDNVVQPKYSRDPAAFENSACISKPVLGTGSVGVRLLGASDDKTPYANEDTFFEGAVTGAQYDYEGVVQDGQIRIMVRVLEKYIEVNGTFAANYFLFHPNTNAEWDASLTECAEKTVAASKIINGAFHVEMRMDGDQAVPIDFANRMGYERLVSYATGEDFARTHVNCFLKDKHDLETVAPKALIQYFCWDQASFDLARKIIADNPDRIFDQLMTQHDFAGESCFGMVVFHHDTTAELLEMISPLGIDLP